MVEERHGKENCLVDSEEAFCGNGIVEDDEQCDCGYAEDCYDICCRGRNNTALQIDPSFGQCERPQNVVCRLGFITFNTDI